MNLVSIVDEDGNLIYELPQPSTYVGTTSTLVDSGRNSKGYVISSVIRVDVAKIELSWKYLTADKWAEVISHFKGTDEDFFLYIKFFNQGTNEYEIRQMYSNDMKTGGSPLYVKDGNIQGWKDCKLNLIEV